MEVGVIILLGLLTAAGLSASYALLMALKLGYSVRKALKEMNK